MERDAPSPAPPPVDVVPPVPWETARRVSLTGLVLVGAAAALGLVATALGDGSPWVLGTARLVLVFAGAVTAGFAVSLRPTLWQTWALGAAAALVAAAGTPAHWDSFRLLFGVLAGVGAAGAVLAAVPPRWRVRAISVGIVYHFGSIFTATTAPQPTPWLTEQLYHRVANPYLQFVYLRNAYHFYSPEPGPASLLACLVETEVGEEVTADGVRRKKYESKWVVLPRRPQDVRDPLGLTYYRRLSLTEQSARTIPDVALPANFVFERSEVWTRRGAAGIPLHPTEADTLEFRLPEPAITRFVLPSYAQHLILEHTPDPAAAARTTVRMYRLEHRTMGVGEFVGFAHPDRRPGDPYHPTTYRPYYLGKFDAHGKLLDPRDPMLYWLVPVVARPAGAPGDAGKKDYVDYLTAHALGVRAEDLDDPEVAARAFNWSQLR